MYVIEIYFIKYIIFAFIDRIISKYTEFNKKFTKRLTGLIVSLLTIKVTILRSQVWK